MWSLRFWLTFGASLLSALVTFLGIAFIQKYAGWGKKNIDYFISFAAGILLGVSFLHIIPEAMEMSSVAPIGLLGGFLILYLLNRIFRIFVCDHHMCNHAFGLIPAIGIGLHSFVDGIIFSVTFNIAIFTGIVAAAGMILHEFPEGIVTFMFLAKSGYKKKKAALFAFLSAALTTPIGTLISYPFISNLNKTVLGTLLSMAAGALVYVSATHLLPETEHGKKWNMVSLFAGIMLAVLIISTHH